MANITNPEVINITEGLSHQRGWQLKVEPSRKRSAELLPIGPANAGMLAKAAANVATWVKGPFYLPQAVNLGVKIVSSLGEDTKKTYAVAWYPKEDQFSAFIVCEFEDEQEANNLCSRLRLKDLDLLSLDYLCLADVN